MTRNDPSFERKNQPEIYAFFEDLKGPMQRTQFLAISRRRKKETHLNFSWEYEHIWKWGPHLGHTDWFLSVCYQWWHVLKHIKTRYKKATYIYSGWWFGTCFVLPYIGKNHPNWLSYFFRGRYTTKQFFFGGYPRFTMDEESWRNKRLPMTPVWGIPGADRTHNNDARHHHGLWLVKWSIQVTSFQVCKLQ